MFKFLTGGDKSSSTRERESEQAKISHIKSMGFDESLAQYALSQKNGDVQAAVALLIEQSEEQVSRNIKNEGIDISKNNSLTPGQRAADAAERRHKAQNERFSLSSRKKQPSPKKNFNNYSKTKQTRPIEEEILELSNDLASYPNIVDLFIYMFKTCLDNPEIQKYREVKTTNKRFKQVVDATPKGRNFLLACGFKPSGDWLILNKSFDNARLYLAKSYLESVKSGTAYKLAKDQIEFSRILEESMRSATKEENLRKDSFKVKVPTEPEEGTAGVCRVTVYVGSKVFQRRFRSDDILADIINWTGSTICSSAPSKLFDKTWELMNKTTYPKKIIDLDSNLNKTLHSNDFWPSAELTIQTAGTLAFEKAEKERDANDRSY